MLPLASVGIPDKPGPSATSETRPQFLLNLLLDTGLVAVPFATLGVRSVWRDRRLRPLALTLIGTIAVYFALDLRAHRDLISEAEPWVTLVFMGIGIAAAVMREQRVLASLRLLRAEAALSAFH